jgi:hypothetical protein
MSKLKMLWAQSDVLCGKNKFTFRWEESVAGRGQPMSYANFPSSKNYFVPIEFQLPSHSAGLEWHSLSNGNQVL